MGSFQNVAMGLGVLTWDGTDVGFLKNNVNYKFNYDIEDFKTGVPLTLQGSVTKEVTAELTAGVAEFTAENFAMALGGLSITTTGGTTTINDAANQERTFAAPTGATLQQITLDGPNVASVVIENVAEDTTYTVNTDYLVDAIRGIVYRNPGGTIGSGATVRVAYTYQQITGKQVELGATFSLTTGALQFTHTRPQNGKTIIIKMWKAQASGTFEANFQEGQFLVNNVTFKALYDSTHPTNPLGYILVQS